MKIYHKLLLLATFCCSLLGTLEARSAGKTVMESEREIPIAYEVDVAVVGGSTAGVAAAVEAARSGATVFLAESRSYLGRDMCGTYRLWLEPGEKPSAPFTLEDFESPMKSLPFTYESSVPSSKVHKDSPKTPLLSNGQWGNAARESVQYEGDADLLVDLGQERSLKNISILIYQRNNVFEVRDVEVLASSDKIQWTNVAKIHNAQLGGGSFENEPIALSTPLDTKTRYLKLMLKQGAKAQRMLLAEILIEENRAPDSLQSVEPLAIRPMLVKRKLDQALLDAGVDFLFGCYATDVLTDSEGRPAGIVMVNRTGRQAVLAKTIIDATDRASVARMAGVRFAPFPAGEYVFQRLVVGGEPRQGDGVEVINRPPLTISPKSGAKTGAIRYALRLPMTDGSFASFAKAEQLARDRTWSREQVDVSETLFLVPPDPMASRKTHQGSWPGPDGIDLDVFRPSGVDRLYVLGGCAGLPRDAANQMLRPMTWMQVGARVGAAAAREAKNTPTPKGVRLAGSKTYPATKGDVLEFLDPLRTGSDDIRFVIAEGHALPVLGEYDVVVVGGGTGGAPAGIAAARYGAKTLVVEYLHGLGGVGTLGLISKYYHGNRIGFTEEVDKGVTALGGPGAKSQSNSWNIEWKMEWYRRALGEAGADVWFGAFGCGAFVEDGRIKGVIVATDQGRGVVLAGTVVDSTGSAHIAASAGAPCRYTDGSHIALQGTGLPPRGLGVGYTNTDYTFVDDTDALDVWRSFVAGREKFEDAYDMGQLIDTRERRQIVGEYFITPLDLYTGRTYADTITIAKSNFDSHGFTVHPIFLLRPPDRQDISAHIPYRCLIPRGLEGVLVTGLGISAHRDAMPVLRMQPDVQNQGYAAGTAAAMAACEQIGVRAVNIKALQEHLIEKKILPKSVLSDVNLPPVSDADIKRAVASLPKNYQGIETVFMNQKRALPLLRKAHAQTTSATARLVYAHLLGVFGDPAGVEILLRTVSETEMDKGWNYTGMGQFGPSMSPLDSLIIALGRTGDKRALAPILKKLSALGPESEFSHFRAISIALETLGDPSAAGPLAALLQKPGMSGHAYTNIGIVRENQVPSRTDTTTRNRSLSELILARALYRCGDRDGLGEKILKQYAQDLRGHYARHARAVLGE